MKIFVDTNILLHFAKLDQIDWKEVVGTVPVTIVISKLVLSELDKHKRGDKKVQKRAREVLNTISTFNGKMLTSAVGLEVAPKPPAEDIFQKLDLEKGEQDHVLIASIVQYKNNNPDDQIVLVTDDTALQLTAPGYEITIAIMPEKYIVKHIDETERELKQLRQELSKIRDAAAKIDLAFSSGLKFTEVEIYKPNFEDFKTYHLQKTIEEHPRLSGHSFAARQNELSPAHIEQYNRYVLQYHKDFGNYLERTERVHIHESLSFPISFKICNTGAVPADEIELELAFPTWVFINYKRNNMWPDRLPFPPTIHRRGTFPGGITQPPSLQPTFDADILRLENDLVISGKAANVVYLELKTVKHKTDFTTGEIFLMVGNYDHAKNFSIEYTLHARNIPDKMKGSLNVKLLKLEK